jgi:hypothetical protein
MAQQPLDEWEAISEEDDWEVVEDTPPTAFENLSAIPSNVVRGLSERISGLAALPGQFVEDPLGTLGEVAYGTVTGPFRGAARLAKAMTTRDPEMGRQYFEDPLSLVEDVASVVAPVQGGTRVLRAPARAAGRGIYGRALKPGTTIPPKKRAAIVETGLKEQIPVSQEGYDRLSQIKEAVANERNVALAEAAARGVTGRPEPLLEAGAGELRKSLSVPEVDPSAPGIIRARLKQVATGPTMSREVPTGGRRFRDIPLEKLEELKEGLQQRVETLGGAFGEQAETPAVRIEKALADAARQQIAELAPGVVAPNARYAALKELQPVLERALGREGNRDLLSPGRVVTGAALAGGGPIPRIVGGLATQAAQKASASTRFGQKLYQYGQGPTGWISPTAFQVLAELMRQRSSGEPEP